MTVFTHPHMYRLDLQARCAPLWHSCTTAGHHRLRCVLYSFQGNSVLVPGQGRRCASFDDYSCPYDRCNSIFGKTAEPAFPVPLDQHAERTRFCACRGKRWGVQTDLAQRTVVSEAVPLPHMLHVLAQRMRDMIPRMADFHPNEANAIEYRSDRGDYLLPHVDDRCASCAHGAAYKHPSAQLQWRNCFSRLLCAAGLKSARCSEAQQQHEPAVACQTAAGIVPVRRACKAGRRRLELTRDMTLLVCGHPSPLRLPRIFTASASTVWIPDPFHLAVQRVLPGFHPISPVLDASTAPCGPQMHVCPSSAVAVVPNSIFAFMRPP